MEEEIIFSQRTKDGMDIALIQHSNGYAMNLAFYDRQDFDKALNFYTARQIVARDEFNDVDTVQVLINDFPHYLYKDPECTEIRVEMGIHKENIGKAYKDIERILLTAGKETSGLKKQINLELGKISDCDKYNEQARDNLRSVDYYDEYEDFREDEFKKKEFYLRTMRQEIEHLEDALEDKRINFAKYHLEEALKRSLKIKELDKEYEIAEAVAGTSLEKYYDELFQIKSFAKLTEEINKKRAERESSRKKLQQIVYNGWIEKNRNQTQTKDSQ